VTEPLTVGILEMSIVRPSTQEELGLMRVVGNGISVPSSNVPVLGQRNRVFLPGDACMGKWVWVEVWG